MSNKYIISGGGTGGHIFPAIAIANEIKKNEPDAEILFVGANGKMEMEKVPAAGYQIVGLDIVGIQRKLTWKNLLFPFKLFKSLMAAKKIVEDFEPDVAIGVGGYASGPLLKMAGRVGVPTLLQEQNSYAGITNKLLAKRAEKICVAYDNMDKFFPKQKVVITGNPVRSDIVDLNDKKTEALAHFDLQPNKKTILILGGSLGARTINQSIVKNIDKLLRDDIQILWQTGKLYFENIEQSLKNSQNNNVHTHAFIARMDLAYATADLVISRAGALSVSELCLVGKPVILVPSPNVAEDHQTKNAMSLVNKNAALLVKDIDAETKLVDNALELLNNQSQCEALSNAIKALAKPYASADIYKEIEKIVNL